MKHPQSRASVGDAAVDGLLAGLAAGVAMAAYLAIAGLAVGENVGALLARFGAGQPVSPLTGALSHLATSAIYGAVFGMLARPLGGRVPGWAGGLLYALILYLLAQFVILPRAESPLRDIAPLHFALSHAVYGLVLGTILGRRA